MYKLKENNGMVTFLLRAGKDFVRSEMPVSSAQAIIEEGEMKSPEKPNYPLNIDDKWHFEAVEVDDDKPDDEPKPQPKKGKKK